MLNVYQLSVSLSIFIEFSQYRLGLINNWKNHIVYNSFNQNRYSEQTELHASEYQVLNISCFVIKTRILRLEWVLLSD